MQPVCTPGYVHNALLCIFLLLLCNLQITSLVDVFEPAGRGITTMLLLSETELGP